MVHLVKKKIGKSEYLYLQRSMHIFGTYDKKATEHIAYIGKVGKYSYNQIKYIMAKANKLPEQELVVFLKQYRLNHKNKSKTK